ncbi:MAG TPA: A/G-specific adenine glycosylase [Xanthomonadales bacterium]|nr:A/G-specific adenine glycosylase [Xanthomonadales bacterium]
MSDFAMRLLDWHDVHGRKDLPWQHPRTPYRVWISEVMLQQTQVATVIGYFDRFVAAFPSVAALATASEDAVLALWSGLGYYSRARNAQRAAQLVVARHGGELPRDLDALHALPGIGRSTAAAILAQAHDEPHAILDGNAKRVLARHAGIDGEIESNATLATLWKEAEARLPRARSADYTQAIMDLGATVCVRMPRCDTCPVATDCIALRDARTHELPRRRAKRAVPERSTVMLVLRDGDDRILLERRPATGIWGGLWSLPECAHAGDAPERAERLAGSRPVLAPLPPFAHQFTHFRLQVTPLAARAVHAGVVRDDERRWLAREEIAALGVPTPVRKLLDRFWSST